MTLQDLTGVMLREMLPSLAKLEAMEQMFITEENKVKYEKLWKERLTSITMGIAEELGLDLEHQKELQRHDCPGSNSESKGN